MDFLLCQDATLSVVTKRVVRRSLTTAKENRVVFVQILITKMNRGSIKGGGEDSHRARFKERLRDFIKYQRQRRRKMRNVARQIACLDNGQNSEDAQTPNSNNSTQSQQNVAQPNQPQNNNSNNSNTSSQTTQSTNGKNKKKHNQQRRAAQIEKHQRKRQFYAGQFMKPEWITTKAPHLQLHSDSWTIVVRPEGERCIIVASRGLTVSRSKSGNILHRWPSELPCGSRKTIGRNENYTLLDCVFHKQKRTYYVIDLMSVQTF